MGSSVGVNLMKRAADSRGDKCVSVRFFASAVRPSLRHLGASYMLYILFFLGVRARKKGGRGGGGGGGGDGDCVVEGRGLINRSTGYS